MIPKQFVDLLDGVRETPRGAIALCPSHADTHQSLSVCVGRDGRILVHCFAGCSAHEICEALDIQLCDLFPKQNIGPQVRKKQRRHARERDQVRRQRQLEGFRIDLLRDAMNLICAARGIDISGWSADRLDHELDRLANAYMILEKESRREH
jgi:hypothetical protein